MTYGNKCVLPDYYRNYTPEELASETLEVTPDQEEVVDDTPSFTHGFFNFTNWSWWFRHPEQHPEQHPKYKPTSRGYYDPYRKSRFDGVTALTVVLLALKLVALVLLAVGLHHLFGWWGVVCLVAFLVLSIKVELKLKV